MYDKANIRVIWICSYIPDNTLQKPFILLKNSYFLKLQVFIGLDRLLTIKLTKWSKVYFTGTRVYVFCFGVIGFFCALNAYFATKNGYIKEIQNSTDTQVICYQSSETDSTLLDIWSWV